MKEKKKLAFYPMHNKVDVYIRNMLSIYAKHYKVVPYTELGIASKDEKDCKVIVLNWYENILDISKLLKLIQYRLKGIKIVWIFHNRLPHEDKVSFMSSVKMRCMIGISNRIILLSKNSRKLLQDYSKRACKKAVHIPVVHHCNDYKAVEKDNRKELEISNQDFVYMFLGTIRPYKNIEMIVDIFNELKLKGAKLLIVGRPFDGKYAKEIKALCQNNTDIILDCRFVEDNEIYAYFNTCDIAIMPYHKESCINSGVMMTAFSCGRTVIIPDIAQARDYRKLCYMYCYNEATEHRERLKDMMLNAYRDGKEIVLQKGKVARKCVLKYNDCDRVSQDVKKMLERM